MRSSRRAQSRCSLQRSACIMASSTAPDSAGPPRHSGRSQASVRRCSRCAHYPRRSSSHCAPGGRGSPSGSGEAGSPRAACCGWVGLRGPAEGSAMSRVDDKVREDFLERLPPTVLFFISLHIVAVIRTLMARGTPYQPLGTFAIAISALILGKAVLLADLLPAINRFPVRPLVYNVMWKTVLYLLFATVL